MASHAFNHVKTLSEAEEYLARKGLNYSKDPDTGLITVQDSIDLYDAGIKKLPDLSAVRLEGSLMISLNYITTLHGAPHYVGGDVFCTECELVTLDGAPAEVGGNFYCQANHLINLEGAPKKVKIMDCGHDESIIELYGAPQNFDKLKTPFGEFYSWSEVPEQYKRTAERIKAENIEGIQSLVSNGITRDLTVQRIKLRKTLC